MHPPTHSFTHPSFHLFLRSQGLLDSPWTDRQTGRHMEYVDIMHSGEVESEEDHHL